MAKLTLLQIVQRVLSAIDSDNVGSIDETVESEQVAELVQTVYEDIISDFPWYHKRTMINLEVTPTSHIMALPDGVEQLLSDIIYYNDKEVFFIPPEKMQYKLRNRDTTLSTVDANGAVNNADPSYWTTYDDENIVFDSYDSNLVSSATQVWAAVFPSAPAVDTDVPDLPHQLHVALLYGVMEEAFRTLKGDGMAAAQYARKALRVRSKAKRWARRANQKTKTNSKVDYGRKHGSSRSSEISSSNVVDGSV